LSKKTKFSILGQIPLIGVGGIETAEDIIERMKAGASLVQSKYSCSSFFLLRELESLT